MSGTQICRKIKRVPPELPDLRVSLRRALFFVIVGIGEKPCNFCGEKVKISPRYHPDKAD